MALLDLAARLATVMALKGQTLVGDMVLDEPLDPLSDALDGSGQGIIAVYSNLTIAKVAQNDLLNANRDLEVTVQIYLPDRVSVDVGGLLVAIDTRNSGAKTVMDIIERQIERVFLVGQSSWARLRRELQFSLSEVRAQSFVVETKSEMKIAAREIVFKMDTISEPGFGAPLLGPFKTFVDLLDLHPHLSAISSYVRSEITSPDDAPDWMRAQGDLGALFSVPASIGISAPLSSQPEDMPPVSEIVVLNEDGGGVTINADTSVDPV